MPAIRQYSADFKQGIVANAALQRHREFRSLEAPVDGTTVCRSRSWPLWRITTSNVSAGPLHSYLSPKRFLFVDNPTGNAEFGGQKHWKFAVTNR